MSAVSEPFLVLGFLVFKRRTGRHDMTNCTRRDPVWQDKNVLVLRVFTGETRAVVQGVPKSGLRANEESQRRGI